MLSKYELVIFGSQTNEIWIAWKDKESSEIVVNIICIEMLQGLKWAWRIRVSPSYSFWLLCFVLPNAGYSMDFPKKWFVKADNESSALVVFLSHISICV